MVQTTIGVEGMMCGMCEAHIQDVVRRSFEIRSVKANRKKRLCVITADEAIPEAKLRAAILETGYTPTSYEVTTKRRLFGR